MNEEKFLYQSDTPSKTIYDRAMKYLDEKYNIRFNTIALELEIQLKENMGNWFVLNINSLLIELAQSGIDINMNKLEILVRSHLIQQYNPIREYFENLETWDGENYIKNLCQYLKTNDDEAFYYLYVYITIYNEDLKDLKINIDKIISILQSRGIKVRQAYFRQEQAFFFYTSINDKSQRCKRSY